MTFLKRQLAFQGLALLLVLAACSVRQMPAAMACSVVNGDTLQFCLDQLPDGGRLALPPGRYTVREPLVLHRRVTLTTEGAPDCVTGQCAVIALRLTGSHGPLTRAVSIAAAGTVLDRVVVQGSRDDPVRDNQKACSGPDRPLMGGLSVSAADVTIRNSVITQVACYSAVGVDAGADGFRFEGNLVADNGFHDRRGMWSDGLTVIDGANDVIRGNVFRDNTDVQLVLGGCRGCSIADNRIENGSAAVSGSFAGLLVHAWPTTSGDYTGSIVTGNTIDCGPERRCGFGIGVGGRAWYVSPTSGGLIAGNSVSRAQVGINVDDATGPVTMRGNRVTSSGGPVRSACGLAFAGPVNISSRSRPYVDATAGADTPPEGVTDRDFAGCLPGL